MLKSQVNAPPHYSPFIQDGTYPREEECNDAIKTFRNDFSHREDLDEAINAWLKETGVHITSIHRHVFNHKNQIGLQQSSQGVLTTVVFREKE